MPYNSASTYQHISNSQGYVRVETRGTNSRTEIFTGDGSATVDVVAGGNRHGTHVTNYHFDGTSTRSARPSYPEDMQGTKRSTRDRQDRLRGRGREHSPDDYYRRRRHPSPDAYVNNLARDIVAEAHRDIERAFKPSTRRYQGRRQSTGYSSDGDYSYNSRPVGNSRSNHASSDKPQRRDAQTPSVHVPPGPPPAQPAGGPSNDWEGWTTLTPEEKIERLSGRIWPNQQQTPKPRKRDRFQDAFGRFTHAMTDGFSEGFSGNSGGDGGSGGGFGGGGCGGS
ncbi:hypothetical protein BKA70DRAFT_1279903 [Coprinopsis sp. MPI-PUGE-AT-0042]|nr:hypothetical protein BKA70DRAFT_1279903 [Coprinopsis sp. MPI-PUGE-AT-0042]